jgi:hypothetical protein
MTTASDAGYYRLRADQERELASQASRQNVAAIHLELVKLYEALAEEPALRWTLPLSAKDNDVIGRPSPSAGRQLA